MTDAIKGLLTALSTVREHTGGEGRWESFDADDVQYVNDIVSAALEAFAQRSPLRDDEEALNASWRVLYAGLPEYRGPSRNDLSRELAVRVLDAIDEAIGPCGAGKGEG